MAATNLNRQKARVKRYVTIIHSILDLARIDAREEGVSFEYKI